METLDQSGGLGRTVRQCGGGPGAREGGDDNQAGRSADLIGGSSTGSGKKLLKATGTVVMPTSGFTEILERP
jgi:hypothetical protein